MSVSFCAWPIRELMIFGWQWPDLLPNKPTENHSIFFRLHPKIHLLLFRVPPVGDNYVLHSCLQVLLTLHFFFCSILCQFLFLFIKTSAIIQTHTSTSIFLYRRHRNNNKLIVLSGDSNLRQFEHIERRLRHDKEFLPSRSITCSIFPAKLCICFR